MSTCKYIASGFIDDATKLYNDFAICHDNDFKTFCSVWKKHKFGCIFMGRLDYKELREFTSEIYQLTLNYMGSSSFDSQVAAIYLLYALYRNQDVISPVKIRISKLQYHIIQHIHAYAVKEKLHDLHYIIDYLKRNCLELVANCTLYSPCCSLNKDNLIKSKTNEFVMLSDLKQDMTIFQEKNIITNLKNMRNQYLEFKNNIMPAPAAVRHNDFTLIDDYKEKIKKLKEVVGKSRDCSSSTTKDTSSHTATVENNEISLGPVVEKSDIGRRRLELKNAASEMKVMTSKIKYNEEFVQECENNKVTKIENNFLKKKRFYNRRPPVNERRMGRPKKYIEKIPTSDDSEDSDFKYSFQILPKQVTKTKRGPIGRRKASYLTNYEGPIILASKQEPIDDYSEISDESLDSQFLEF